VAISLTEAMITGRPDEVNTALTTVDRPVSVRSKTIASLAASLRPSLPA